MQLTQLIAVIVALAVLTMLVRRGRIHRLNGEEPEQRYRRDIQALRRGRRIPVTGRRSGDVWSAGAASAPPHSRTKKAAAWVALGSVGGCAKAFGSIARPPGHPCPTKRSPNP